MNNRLINKMFFNTTVVQFFSMLIMELGVFVDGAIIGGCLGSEAMASYGFALPIATVISGVSTFFFAGISALCGRAVARGDTKTSNRIFSQCILVSMITSVSLLLICFGNADRLAVLSGARNGLERETADYIRGYALWGTPKDIAPFIDPVFENNILLTKTERLTMSSRPKNPKYARNKNVIVIGGSGSGKTRGYVKPNLMQCESATYPVSFVVTDPKGSIFRVQSKECDSESRTLLCTLIFF